jgi:excisionase family DNA binding protein
MLREVPPMAPTPLTIELPAELIERIAARAAELLAEREAEDRWLTVEQAAQHLGVSASHVYELCARRRTNGFPAVKEGSRTYLKLSQLDAWRQNQATTNGGPR